MLSQIWYPNIKYLIVSAGDWEYVFLDLYLNSIVDFYSELDQTVNIMKEGKPILSNSSQIYPSETYEGSENTIVMESVITATFVCTFSDIGNYPFNSEICYFKLFISGTDNRFTDLKIASITDNGQKEVDDYKIKSWTMEQYNATTGTKGK